jgi:hypothetical protein
VLALAFSRAEGAIKVGQWRKETAQDRGSNVAWAVQALRALADARKNDPAMKTDLAEVLARDPKTAVEASTILEELAAKDLVTSARGYRALAALRDARGEATGRDAALQRCRTMAKTPEICADPKA